MDKFQEQFEYEAYIGFKEALCFSTPVYAADSDEEILEAIDGHEWKFASNNEEPFVKEHIHNIIEKAKTRGCDLPGYYPFQGREFGINLFFCGAGHGVSFADEYSLWREDAKLLNELCWEGHVFEDTCAWLSSDEEVVLVEILDAIKGE